MDSKRIFLNVFHYLSIKTELESFDKIHEEINKGIIFRDTNLWILLFAIVVASVGLNMNSTAVIIGAMLISPLMGPINGIGYSIATYNFDLLRASLKNFSYAVAISLVGSTGYFLLTPISVAHSELLARTTPSIYDVIIAFFGGLAGIVAMSSKNKGNVIPGVAIATALMPPLCTAGYGLATLQFGFFFGAFYLFTINTVFIAIASMIISKLLKFPLITLIDNSRKKKINRIIYLIIFIVLVPSIYLGYNLIQKEKFIENANKYVSNISSFEGNYLLKSKIIANENKIILTYGGKNLSETQKNVIIQKATNFGLNDSKILIEQGLTFDEIDSKDKEVVKLKNEFQENILIKEKQYQLDSLIKITYVGNSLLKELRNFYPQIKACSYAQSILFSNDENNQEKISFVYFIIDSNKGLFVNDKEKINDWVKTRLNEKNIKIFYK